MEIPAPYNQCWKIACNTTIAITSSVIPNEDVKGALTMIDLNCDTKPKGRKWLIDYTIIINTTGVRIFHKCRIFGKISVFRFM